MGVRQYLYRHSPPACSLCSILGGCPAAGCRSHRASVATLSTGALAATLNFPHVEACASGDFVNERSPPARACRGTCQWRLDHGRRPQGSRLRQHLGGARTPHALVLIPFQSCTCACVATLSTCSSEVTSNLAQAHVRASCSAARSLEPPALAKVLAQPLIGSPSLVAVAHTWPLCPRAAEHLGGARKPHAVFLMPFQSCTCAAVATLSTCSLEVTCNLKDPACANIWAEPANRTLFF